VGVTISKRVQIKESINSFGKQTQAMSFNSVFTSDGGWEKSGRREESEKER
jgi:hypothetical protein